MIELTVLVLKVFPDLHYSQKRKCFLNDHGVQDLRSREAKTMEQAIEIEKKKFSPIVERGLRPNIYQTGAGALHVENPATYKAACEDMTLQLAEECVQSRCQPEMLREVFVLRAVDVISQKTVQIRCCKRHAFVQLLEGKVYNIKGLCEISSESNYPIVMLKTTEFTEIQESDTLRKCLPLGEVWKRIDSALCPMEVDVVGKVMEIEADHGDIVTLCNTVGEQLKLKFWPSIEEMGFGDVVIKGKVLCISNLAVRTESKRTRKLFVEVTTKISSEVPFGHFCMEFNKFQSSLGI